jgi:hypothetical protein
VGPRAGLDAVVKRKISAPADRPAHSLVSTLIELSRLQESMQEATQNVHPAKQMVFMMETAGCKTVNVCFKIRMFHIRNYWTDFH